MSHPNNHQLIVPGSDLIHCAWRKVGSSWYDYDKTACLMEVEPNAALLFERTTDEPTCLFCIRDGVMIEELRVIRWNAIVGV